MHIGVIVLHYDKLCGILWHVYFLQGDFDDEQQSSLPDPSCGYVDMFMYHILVMNMHMCGSPG